MKAVVIVDNGFTEVETETVSTFEKNSWNGKADQSTTYTMIQIDTKIGDIETLLGAI